MSSRKCVFETGAEAVFVSDRERLIGLACRIVESRAVAEEIVQDSWIRWDSHSYEPKDARPIFRRIVTNLAKDWRRRRTAETAALAEVQTYYAASPSTENAIVAKSELLRVVKTLKKMPRRNIVAFRLRNIEGKTYKEIAARLDLSISHARNLVEQVIVEVILALDE